MATAEFRADGNRTAILSLSKRKIRSKGTRCKTLFAPRTRRVIGNDDEVAPAHHGAMGGAGLVNGRSPHEYRHVSCRCIQLHLQAGAHPTRSHHIGRLGRPARAKHPQTRTRPGRKARGPPQSPTSEKKTAFRGSGTGARTRGPSESAARAPRMPVCPSGQFRGNCAHNDTVRCCQRRPSLPQGQAKAG